MSTITNPMHPGEFIKLAFMEPLEIGVTALAEKLGVSTSTLSRILNEKSDLSYDMAVRLSYVLGRSQSLGSTSKPHIALQRQRPLWIRHTSTKWLLLKG